MVVFRWLGDFSPPVTTFIFKFIAENETSFSIIAIIISIVIFVACLTSLIITYRKPKIQFGEVFTFNFEKLDTRKQSQFNAAVDQNDPCDVESSGQQIDACEVDADKSHRGQKTHSNLYEEINDFVICSIDPVTGFPGESSSSLRIPTAMRPQMPLPRHSTISLVSTISVQSTLRRARTYFGRQSRVSVAPPTPGPKPKETLTTDFGRKWSKEECV